MKISRLRTQPIDIPLDPPILVSTFGIRSLGCVLVTLETDAGVFGESLIFTVNGKRLQVLDAMVRSLEPLILGRDPELTEAFWAEAWKDTRWLGHSGATVFGIAAIDGALWDIRGKAAAKPIWRLIGGYRDAIPAYASGGLWLSLSIDELLAEAERFRAAGFRAMKMRIGKPSPAEDVERVRRLREALGPDIALMADANQAFTVDQAIRLGRELEEFGLTWLEEPVNAYDHAGEAQVAAALDTPIATGETEYTRYAFRTMLEMKSAEVLMPDLQRVGGVSEFIKVAHLAAAFDVPVSSHLFSEESVQILGGLANATWLEHMPWFARLYNEELELKDGMALVPERPGWGFTFDAKAVKRLLA